MNAKLVSFSELQSVATAYSELMDESGNILATMQIDYHVIKASDIPLLFPEYVNTDQSWQTFTNDPYSGEVNFKGDVFYENEKLTYIHDELKPEECVGHFKDLPAFPVSIMTRYAGMLVERAYSEQHGVSKVEVKRGICSTEQFAFAGEDVKFTAYPNPDDRLGGHWFCDITQVSKTIARLDYFIS